jgi:hypothetical protein
MHQWVWILIALASVTGCGGLRLDAAPSRDVPLTGTWVVDSAASDDVGSAMRPDAKFGDRRQRMSTAAEIQRIRRGSGLAYVAHDFQVLDAKRMRIELDSDSMGIQHYPGIYRDVTWGIRERGIWKVQAGWDNDVLVVASKTRGINVLERYQLQGRSRLLVSLDIEADGNVRSISRSFQRRR